MKHHSVSVCLHRPYLNHKQSEKDLNPGKSLTKSQLSHDTIDSDLKQELLEFLLQEQQAACSISP